MADPQLSSGMLVGETWEILEPIGRGGMGEVWRARHVRVEGKQAAIKVLRATTDGMPDQVARFRREAEIAARLEHPNIVQLFDFSSLPSGAPYLVMELLRGESLGKRLSRGVMPFAELQEVVVQVGSALHVAHAAGVVHRDLKPENIFLVATPTGTQVKVLDFGISKLVGSDSLQTSDSIVLGTPQYMSPEQAMAEHSAITGQSDVFSLGTICFEALTGHRPFAAATLARTVYLVAMEPSPSLRTFAPDLPEHVIDAVDHALSKLPEDRTPDVASFVKQLCGVTISASGNRRVTPAVDPAVETVARPAPKNVQVATISSRQPAAAPARRMWPLVAILATLVAAVAAQFRPDPSPIALLPPAPPVLDAGVTLTIAMPEPEPAPSPVEDASDAGSLPVVRVSVKAPSATAEQQELLDSARAAAARDDWNQVIEWSLKPAIAERHDAITLRVLAWCHLGNLSMVTAYKGRLAAHDKGAVARACREQGIDL